MNAAGAQQALARIAVDQQKRDHSFVQHLVAFSKALDLLVEDRGLTQKELVARTELPYNQVRSILGRGQQYSPVEGIARVIWACHMTPGEFYKVLYGLYDDEELELSPPDVRQRVERFQEILDGVDFLPLQALALPARG